MKSGQNVVPLSEILTQNKDANWLKINNVLSFFTYFCAWKRQFEKCCYVSKYLNIWFDLTLSSLTYLISLIIIIVVSDGDGSCGREDEVRHDMIYNIYYSWINIYIISYHLYNK